MNNFTEQSIARLSQPAIARYYNLLDELCSESQTPVTAKKLKSQPSGSMTPNFDAWMSGWVLTRA